MRTCIDCLGGAEFPEPIIDSIPKTWGVGIMANEYGSSLRFLKYAIEHKIPYARVHMLVNHKGHYANTKKMLDDCCPVYETLAKNNPSFELEISPFYRHHLKAPDQFLQYVAKLMPSCKIVNTPDRYSGSALKGALSIKFKNEIHASPGNRQLGEMGEGFNYSTVEINGFDYRWDSIKQYYSKASNAFFWIPRLSLRRRIRDQSRTIAITEDSIVEIVNKLEPSFNQGINRRVEQHPQWIELNTQMEELRTQYRAMERSGSGADIFNPTRAMQRLADARCALDRARIELRNQLRRELRNSIIVPEEVLAITTPEQQISRNSFISTEPSGRNALNTLVDLNHLNSLRQRLREIRQEYQSAQTLGILNEYDHARFRERIERVQNEIGSATLREIDGVSISDPFVQTYRGFLSTSRSGFGLEPTNEWNWTAPQPVENSIPIAGEIPITFRTDTEDSPWWDQYMYAPNQAAQPTAVESSVHTLASIGAHNNTAYTQYIAWRNGILEASVNPMEPGDGIVTPPGNIAEISANTELQTLAMNTPSDPIVQSVNTPALSMSDAVIRDFVGEVDEDAYEWDED